MRTVLLDSHVVVWSLLSVSRLSSAARRAIDNADALLVSAATLYELNSKRRFGARSRADMLDQLPAHLLSYLPARGFELIPISPEAAWRAASMELSHGDPWDRILAAQAELMGIPLITSDTVLRRQVTSIETIW